MGSRPSPFALSLLSRFRDKKVGYASAISRERRSEAATATLTLPPGAIRQATTARLTLSGSPAGLMLRSLSYLHAVDYGTTENVVGWFLPDMTVAMALRDLGVHYAPLEQGLPRRVRDNIARLYTLQAPEGGWGWGGAARADAFWTAYALYGLVQARKAGYLVDGGVISRGVEALQRLLPAVKDPSNRALALYVLTVAGHPDIFVAGDICAFMQDGRQLPGVAQVAKQQGAHAAKNVLRAIRGEPLQPFHYVDFGNVATIGRGAAVVDIGPVRASGWLAWVFWLFLHIFWLIGFRNRIAVLIEWAWAYVSFNKGARLITRNFQAETRPPK